MSTYLKRKNIPFSPPDMTEAEANRTLLTMPKDEYESMCNRARATAAEFDYKVLTNKLAQLF